MAKAVDSAPSQLTRYLERIARFLMDNKPSYAKRHAVTVQTFKHGVDEHCIKLSIMLYVSESKLIELDKGKLIESEA